MVAKTRKAREDKKKKKVFSQKVTMLSVLETMRLPNQINIAICNRFSLENTEIIRLDAFDWTILLNGDTSYTEASASW